jgi:hypothetical protein
VWVTFHQSKKPRLEHAFTVAVGPKAGYPGAIDLHAAP